MEKQNELLKYIYHEDLYLIDEPAPADEQGIPEPSRPTSVAEESAKNEPESVVNEPEPITFLGNNEKGILFLVNDPSDDLLNQSDLDLLMKIVESGLKCSKSDIAIVNTAIFPVHQVLDEIAYTYLISFGVDLADFHGTCVHYEMKEDEKCTVLLSDELTLLQQDVNKKQKLWAALKSMFHIQ